MYTIKKLYPSQASLVLNHLKRLDEESLHDRFCMFMSHEALEKYVAQMDFDMHGIYGVFDQNLDLVGLGECVKNKKNWQINHGQKISVPLEEAEVAFSIEKNHQGKGLGNRLMKRMIQYAKAHHVDNLQMYCLRSNVKSHHIAQKYGLKVTHDRGEVLAQIKLPQSPAVVQQVFEAIEEAVASFEIFHKKCFKNLKFS